MLPGPRPEGDCPTTARSKPNEDRIVFIIDDDPWIRESLMNLLASLQIPSMGFGSAKEYITSRKPDCTACVLLDINLPDINGLALQRQLLSMNHPPIIFITGNGDIPSTVQAMKAGAIDFLAKPFQQERLLNAINEALTCHAKSRIERAEMEELRLRLSHLTPREREVLPLVVSGLLNKQTAAELGISEITCQVHRGHIMRKMAANSLAELVRMASKLGILPPTILTR